MSNPLFTLVHYLDVSEPPPPASAVDCPAAPQPSALTEEQIQLRIDEACRRERHSTEERLALHYEQQLAQQLAHTRAALQQSLAATLQDFAAERSSYFARAESEIVHLALGIARKILQREAQLDPLLLAGLVRVALDGLAAESAVTLRVAPAQLGTWQQHTGAIAPRHTLTLCPDPSLSADECTLQTSSGTARLSYEVQLKEVERGFLDLLDLRPDHPTPQPPSPSACAPPA